MRVGLVLQTEPSSGGAHSFEAAFQRELLVACNLAGYDLVSFYPDSLAITKADKNLRYKLTPTRMGMAHLRAQPILYRLLCFVGLGASNLERVAQRQNVDILIFASPNHLAPGIHRFPLASTFWDFGHVDLPQASETALGGLWGWREDLYQKTLRRSITVFCDSFATAKRLESEYKVPSERITRIGLLPNVENAEAIHFDKPHFIYAAMFWPHKNHLMLLRAFRQFLDSSDTETYLILTGEGKSGAKIRAFARELGLQDNVKFEGLVSRHRLSGLIRGSLGLLMPSMLGPSNLPPLEAALLGVPAIISDNHSMEDLLSGGTYVDVSSEEDWTNGMHSLLKGVVSPATPTMIPVASLLEEELRRISKQLEPWSSK